MNYTTEHIGIDPITASLIVGGAIKLIESGVGYTRASKELSDAQKAQKVYMESKAQKDFEQTFSGEKKNSIAPVALALAAGVTGLLLLIKT